MQHKCKVTVLDKKLYPELQAQYCADPHAGPCPCYHVGDEYIFERYGQADDFWPMGAGTCPTRRCGGRWRPAGPVPSQKSTDFTKRRSNPNE